nr:dihydropteroate synthase [Chitinophagaceae bacterium]
ARLHACREAGIHDVIIDPGFGFAKTAAHNFRLLQQLYAFKILGRPLLLGVSRKSTIYKTLGVTAAEALNGTTVLNTIGLLKGASILRVHDVKEAVA